MNIRIAQESDLAEIEVFYATVGYTGGVLPTDYVLVARASDGILGVVRLCEEFEVLVLRGMYVGESQRRSGIGKALLSELSAKIGSRECWCIPFAHLRGFYGRIGFEETAATKAPKFLAERCARYIGEGADMIIMARPREWFGAEAREERA